MNCTDFQDRMQQLIDDRLPLRDDEELNVHAMTCCDCCQQMETWQEIESVLGCVDAPESSLPMPSQPTFNGRLISIVATAAAILLVVTAFGRFQQDTGVQQVAMVPAVTLDDRKPVDPTLWWQSVQHRDWISQTMPAVQSMRDGVAPLGRSLIQAVAILTTTGGHQTS